MKKSCSAVLAALIALGVCGAPPATRAAEPPRMIKLEPKKLDGVAQGKAVVVKGEAGPQPHRFGLEQVSYMTPVAVAVRPVNRGDDVGLTLTKYAWNQPLREGRTSGDVLRYVFRTEGEFQVAVDAKKPGTPYRLLVWVGDEMKPQFTPIVVKASEHRGAQQAGGPPVMWVIAGALIAIALLLGVLVMRRRPS